LIASWPSGRAATTKLDDSSVAKTLVSAVRTRYSVLAYRRLDADDSGAPAVRSSRTIPFIYTTMRDVIRLSS